MHNVAEAIRDETEQLGLASVLRLSEGMPALIITENKQELVVDNVASHVPLVQQGDQVMYSNVEGKIIILAVLTKYPSWWRVVDNTLQFQFGKAQLCFNEDGHVTLKTPKTQLLIDKSGDVRWQVKRDMILNSDRHIHLNSLDV